MEPPSTVVLAVSRQIGSGGSYIGQAVAHRHGLKYLDREILAEATRMLGAEDQNLAHLEEHVANTWVRFTRHLSLGPPDALFTPPRIRETIFEEELFQIERQVIRELAAREDCVIIGRGACFVLADRPGLVRVFVHAPEAFRIAQLEKTLGPQDRPAMRDLIRKSDRDRGKFVRAVCNCDWTNACHYDLTVDPGKIGLDAAADLVARVVEDRLHERKAGMPQTRVPPD
jgi:cytidylate kinase